MTNRSNDNLLEPTVKTLRQSIDITQEELSRRLNLSFRTVGDWETGKKLPRFDNAIALSRELKVPLKVLAKAMGIDVTGIPDDQPPKRSRTSPPGE